ncbi:MAG: type II CAAX endopeptidase family protein, partial [Spirulinaceae cyanobacterium]
MLLSLGDSLGQPQVQSRLELYQTNLVLHSAEYQVEGENSNLTTSLKAIIGENPYATAQKQYEKAQEFAQTSLTSLKEQLSQGNKTNTSAPNQEQNTVPPQQTLSPQEKALRREISAIDEFIDNLNLHLGILQAQLGEPQKAQQTWQNSIKNNHNSTNVQTAQTLINLWDKSQKVNPNSESQLEKNLDSWFRYRSLSKLYEVQNKPEALTQLRKQEQKRAEQALIKLAVISGLPALGGILGVTLIIFLLVQLATKGQQSLLATNHNLAWNTPWDWEITWQVLIVGFFAISQLLLPLLLPLLFSLLGINPATFSLRAKAFYVLTSYLLMAGGGFLVLYLSLKKYFPLPEDWFRLRWLNNWFLWGLGGYLVALPIVVIVSLVNQQIWQGQGGSNPIILLALQSQDKLALVIFFFTASIAAPIFEEIIFRGFLLPSLTRYIPVWTAIVVSSLIFSIAHLSLSEVLPLTALGMVLGFVYSRSRNLLAPMLLHSLWNGGTLLS